MQNQPQINPSTTVKPKKTNLLAILVLIAVLLGAIIIAGYYYFVPEDRANKNINQVLVNINTNAVADNTNESKTTNQNENISTTSNTNSFISLSAIKNPEEAANNLSRNFVTYKELKNPFTGVTYSIKTDPGEEYCGRNGSTICQLVKINTAGQETYVADLFFPINEIQTETGARLVKFTDANTLILGFGSQDHGGGFNKISSYNLTSTKLEYLIYYGQGESSGGEVDNYWYGPVIYTFKKGEKTVYVSNDRFPNLGLPERGVYFQVKDVTPKKIEVEQKPYYSVEFNIMDNYANRNIINFTLNGVVYKFDFDTAEIKKN